MQAIELDTAYNPSAFEDRVYEEWEAGGYFAPGEVREGEEPFSIVIPPPNVTGALHLGHGLNNTLQDLLVRYQRMRGRPTLWVPGTDHAGIATQSVVEKKLAQRGVDRQSLGRKRFVRRTLQTANKHMGTIRTQLKKIGSSCDWSRERFTLDEGLSEAVREVFVSLYERGLIYRGTYLVNWSVGAQTALSDEEVEFKEVDGNLYHFRYPLADKSGHVQFATTRPETMLGDAAIAVHPDDERYAYLVGKEVDIPLNGRRIPIIADSYVDPEFGTGMVKITPAHDAADYEVGKRHGLPEYSILNPDGTLNDDVPEKYRGMSIEDARKAVISDMGTFELFVEVKPHRHQVGHCYRTGVPIQPLLSTQWFVRMRPLAEKALAAWERGDVRFYPKRWENTYTHWLKNIRDWCISRQLWWGHRIPVWYDLDTGEMIVSRSDPKKDPANKKRRLEQDPDVLDTWFSSWLWPFSTLGWPERTDDLKRFYPTSALVTAYDIIFFWVARMIMAGIEFTGEVPFRDIYITSLVRDKKGRKMSKSLRNGIDPLEIVREFGADSLKFTLAFLSTQGQDILLDKKTFALGSRFANKIWNAARYILMNLEGRELLPQEAIDLRPADRWVYHRLNEAAASVASAMEQYRYDDASKAVYEFFWNDFCDWYIEASKLDLYASDPAEQDRAASLLVYLLEESMRLLHPFLSFLTEEIYGRLPYRSARAAIVGAYPVEREDRYDEEVSRDFAVLQDIVRKVRALRSEFTIPPGNTVRFAIAVTVEFPPTPFLEAHIPLIEALSGGSDVTIVRGETAAGGAISLVGSGFTVFVYVRDVIDVAAAYDRIKKTRDHEYIGFQAAERRLRNDGFLQNARPEIIERERVRWRDLSDRIAKMDRYLAELK